MPSTPTGYSGPSVGKFRRLADQPLQQLAQPLLKLFGCAVVAHHMLRALSFFRLAELTAFATFNPDVPTLASPLRPDLLARDHRYRRIEVS